jgi:hypothetical protein
MKKLLAIAFSIAAFAPFAAQAMEICNSPVRTCCAVEGTYNGNVRSSQIYAPSWSTGHCEMDGDNMWYVSCVQGSPGNC